MRPRLSSAVSGASASLAPAALGSAIMVALGVGVPAGVVALWAGAETTLHGARETWPLIGLGAALWAGLGALVGHGIGRDGARGVAPPGPPPDETRTDRGISKAVPSGPVEIAVDLPSADAAILSLRLAGTWHRVPLTCAEITHLGAVCREVGVRMRAEHAARSA